MSHELVECILYVGFWYRVSGAHSMLMSLYFDEVPFCIDYCLIKVVGVLLKCRVVSQAVRI